MNFHLLSLTRPVRHHRSVSRCCVPATGHHHGRASIQVRTILACCTGITSIDKFEGYSRMTRLMILLFEKVRHLRVSNIYEL